MADIHRTSLSVDSLASAVGRDWPAIRKAAAETHRKRAELTRIFEGSDSPDTSLIVFGSVAREEVTAKSDLDWILLIDGQSAPEHKAQEREAKSKLLIHKFIEPGASGVFGKMVERAT